MKTDTFHTHIEENILLKAHQHTIILLLGIIKYFVFFGIPLIIFWYLGMQSWFSTVIFTLVVMSGIILYRWYLWYHSWLMIGTQKVTLLVRNGIFSQYAMNIRYTNIRDCAVSKGSILSFLLKYGTLFIRSSAGDVDNFYVHHVPGVGNIYSLINILCQFSNEQRKEMKTLEDVYTSSHKTVSIEKQNSLEENITILSNIAGITSVIELEPRVRTALGKHEEIRNHGVHEVLRRKHVLCFLHNATFRMPSGPITATTASGEVYFPGVPFPEVQGKDVISASPGPEAHRFLSQFFPYIETNDATVLVGWNE
jgi:hypothetical protein